jgi:hypothetical protein
MSKKKQTFKCHKCNSKLTQLIGVFGTWPSDNFKKKSDVEKQEFMRQMHACASSVEVKIKATELLETFEEHAEFYLENGEFLPESVWNARGFPGETIREKARPADIQEHDVLGKCYRCVIRCTGLKGERGQKRSSQSLADTANPAAGSSAGLAASGSGNAGSGAVGQQTRGSRSCAKSSSSSSESTSDKSKKTTSKKEKKKAQKKAKKEKDAERDRVRKAKVLEKEGAKKRKVAVQLEAKISSVVLLMRNTMDRPASLSLPDVAVQSLQKQLAELDVVHKKARLAIDDPNAHELPVNLQTASKMVRSAKKALALIDGMLAQVNKLASGGSV